MLQWLAAFDKYALAAQACNVWQYSSAMCYKDIVLQISLEASAEGRRHYLAIIYDGLARKEWSDRAYQGDTSFDINVASAELQPHLLRRAKNDYDQGNSKGKGKGKGNSWNNSDWGHNNSNKHWQPQKSHKGGRPYEGQSDAKRHRR